MSTSSPVQKTNETSLPLIVPTYRSSPLIQMERGLLMLDANGVSYTPIARTWANASAVLVVAVAAWGVLNILNALSGGFIGFVWNVAAILVLAFLPSIGFALAVSKQAEAQEKTAKTSGFAAVQALEGGWKLAWDEIVATTLPSRPPYIMELRAKSGITYKLPFGIALNFGVRKDTVAAVSDTANAIRNELARHVSRA